MINLYQGILCHSGRHYTYRSKLTLSKRFIAKFDVVMFRPVLFHISFFVEEYFYEKRNNLIDLNSIQVNIQITCNLLYTEKENRTS